LVKTTKKGRAEIAFATKYSSYGRESHTWWDISDDSEVQDTPLRVMRTAIRLFKKLLNESPHVVTLITSRPTDRRRALAYHKIAKILGIQYKNLGKYK
jgi:hypothetical protein